MPSDKPWISEDPKGVSYQYIHDNLPGGPEGLVTIDSDLFLRRHGNLCNGDRIGKLKLLDFKSREARLYHNYAQLMTLKLADDVMKNSRISYRYEGLYEVYTDYKFWHTVDTFEVNGNRLERNEFDEWLKGNLTIPGYSFEDAIKKCVAHNGWNVIKQEQKEK